MFRLSAPRRSTFLVGVVLVALGVLLQLEILDITLFDSTDEPFWLVTAGAAALGVGALLPGI